METYILIDDTLNKGDLRKVYIYHKNSKDFKIGTYKVFVNIDDVQMSGTIWTCFQCKDNKPFCFDCFGGQQQKFSLQRLPKPKVIMNLNIKITVVD